MAKIVRDSGDGDASILDTNIGISGSSPLESGLVELGAAADFCGMLDMVVTSSTNGMKTRDVVSKSMCDVGQLIVGMVPTSNTTPFAMSSEVVVSSNLVNDRLQLVTSRLQSKPLTEIGAFYRHYTVRYAHLSTFDDHVDELMIQRCTLVPSAYHQLWDSLTPQDESCDGHDMALGSTIDSLIIHDLEQEFWSDASAGVVIDSTPLAMTSPDLASDQSQWVVSLVHGELLTKVGFFYQHYIVGYVHQLAFDPYVEELMAGKFDLGSISCCLSCDGFSPLGVHGSYDYEIVASDL